MAFEAGRAACCVFFLSEGVAFHAMLPKDGQVRGQDLPTVTECHGWADTKLRVLADYAGTVLWGMHQDSNSPHLSKLAYVDESLRQTSEY